MLESGLVPPAEVVTTGFTRLTDGARVAVSGAQASAEGGGAGRGEDRRGEDRRGEVPGRRGDARRRASASPAPRRRRGDWQVSYRERPASDRGRRCRRAAATEAENSGSRVSPHPPRLRRAIPLPQGGRGARHHPAHPVNISAPFILRPVATALLAVAVLLAGILGYRQLSVSSLPQVDFPTIEVTTQLPGANPDTIATLVTASLERQFGQIPSLASMASQSSFGLSQITLQFNLDRDIDAAAQDVQSAINAAASTLPRNLPYPPTYSKVNPADTPVLTLALTSKTVPLRELSDVADTLLAPRLSQVTGVGHVSVPRATSSRRSASRRTSRGSPPISFRSRTCAPRSSPPTSRARRVRSTAPSSPTRSRRTTRSRPPKPTRPS